MKHYDVLSSFIVQVVQTGDDTLITIQNIKTREMSVQLSWHDILSVMQKACAAEGRRAEPDTSVNALGLSVD